jgi:hypothetical protein
VIRLKRPTTRRERTNVVLGLLSAQLAALAFLGVASGGCNGFTAQDRCGEVEAFRVFTAALGVVAVCAAAGYARRLLGREGPLAGRALAVVLWMIPVWVYVGFWVSRD